MSERAARRQSGLTLLEALAALLIASIVMLALAGIVRAQIGLHQRRLESGADRQARLVLGSRLESLVGRAQPETLANQRLAFVGTRRRLGFVSLDADPGPDRLRWLVLQHDPGTRKLLLDRHPFPQGMTRQDPPEGNRFTLLDEVEGLELTYWRPATADRRGTWLTDWSREPGLPAAIRIALTRSRPSLPAVTLVLRPRLTTRPARD